MLATIVPWPSWSPVAPGESDEKLTLATIRPAKFDFVGSMPLSTIAIAGAGGAMYAASGEHVGSSWSPVSGSVAHTVAGWLQSDVMSVVCRHISAFW